ncbi:MAG: flavodoxin [Kosmotogaceae bacterium]|nr:flavodoxin [Kosmotogaceae bacterium]
MSRTVVLYKTRYGSSKKYAEWIAEEVQGDLFDIEDVDPERLQDCDCIVFGGSLYATGIIGLSTIKENFESIENKKVIIFSVGASPARTEVIEDIKAKNFSPEIAEKIEFFHLRGGFDFKRLRLVDKILMTLLKSKLKAKRRRGEELSSDEKGMLAAYKTAVDFTNRKAIEPIVESVRRFTQGNT